MHYVLSYDGSNIHLYFDGKIVSKHLTRVIWHGEMERSQSLPKQDTRLQVGKLKQSTMTKVYNRSLTTAS